MADPPASVAPGAPAVWIGSEIVVWGGGFGSDEPRRVGGASYDPVADAWAELPEAPMPAPAGHSAVWTGQEILYWGGADGGRSVQPGMTNAGVAYEPVSRKWRRMADSPLAARSQHEAVWTGEEMIVWGGVTQCCPIDSIIHDPTAAAYNPETDTWRNLRDAPVPWSGGDGYAVSEAFEGDMFVWRNYEFGRYSVEKNVWQSLGSDTADAADPPLSMSTAGPVGVGAVIGEAVYLWTGGARAERGSARTLPGGGVKPTADSPHFTDFVPRLAPAADGIFAVNYDWDMYEPGEGTSVWRYDVVDDSWERLPNPPAEVGAGATPVWTGSQLVVLPSTYGEDQKKGTGAVWSKR